MSSPTRSPVTSLPPQPLSPLDGRYRAAVGDLAELPLRGRASTAPASRSRWSGSSPSPTARCSAPRRCGDATRRACARSYLEFGQAEIDWLAEQRGGDPPRRQGRRVPRARPALERSGSTRVAELTHFACTSEDINTTSYALTVQRAVHARVAAQAARPSSPRSPSSPSTHRDAAMLVAHPRPAGDARRRWARSSAVFAWRLARVGRPDRGRRVPRRSSPARPAPGRRTSPPTPTSTGRSSRASSSRSLGLGFNLLTTQIESHDWQVELYDRVRHAGGILHNLAHRRLDLHLDRLLHADPASPVRPARRRCRTRSTRSASRTPRPTSRSPAACSPPSRRRWSTSRLQRDLTDSTTQRNIGVAFGHSLLALDNLQRGLGEISLAEDVLLADLDGNWEVLAEAIQTVVRAEIAAGRSQITDPYALLEGPHPRPPRRRAPSSPSSCAASTSATPRRSACWRSPRRRTTGLASKLVDELG